MSSAGARSRADAVAPRAVCGTRRSPRLAVRSLTGYRLWRRWLSLGQRSHGTRHQGITPSLGSSLSGAFRAVPVGDADAVVVLAIGHSGGYRAAAHSGSRQGTGA
jgi:hypothetical protein